MKVLVTVKEVAAVEDDFEISGTEIESTYLDYDLNEWDDYAVEEGVQLAEAGDDVEVVAVTIGPERSEETIRMALAKGADRAVRVWDDAIERVVPDTNGAIGTLRERLADRLFGVFGADRDGDDLVGDASLLELDGLLDGVVVPLVEVVFEVRLVDGRARNLELVLDGGYLLDGNENFHRGKLTLPPT